jgi:hypothetical protein
VDVVVYRVILDGAIEPLIKGHESSETARKTCGTAPHVARDVQRIVDELVAQNVVLKEDAEVTRLFHPKGAAPFARREIESFHPKIMRRAQALARSEGLPVLDVPVYFSDRQPLKLEETARLLVDFVRDHPIDDCETRVIPFGERHLRQTVAEFVEHYHRERNHQGLENELIDGGPTGHRPNSPTSAPWGAAQLLRSRSVRERRFDGSAQQWDITQ